MSNYISLYRKYRPKTFSDVVGQKVTVEILKNSIMSNKIGHAYLFSGPRGTGKTSVAKIFSHAVNCLDTKDGDLCGKCQNCLSKDENEIDIIEIDAASNNGVDEIREIRNNVKLLPSNLKYKVYIIDEVHMLSDSAFNALLKTLEEPPSHVIFILATTEINKIPSTVLSRCQKFNFKKLNNKEIVDRLKYICSLENRNKDISEDCLNLIANISDGGLRDAINLLDQVLSINNNVTKDDVYDLVGSIDENMQFEIMDNIFESKIKELINNINYIYENGKNINIILNNLHTIIENIIIYNNTDNYFDGNYELKLSRYTKIDSNKLIESIKQLFELNYNLKRSSNQKILVEIYFMKIALLFNEDEMDNDKFNLEDSTNFKKNNENSLEHENDNEIYKIDSEYKKILINNCLCLAKKDLKNEFLKQFVLVNDYITDKEYNSIANLLIKSTPEVVSNKSILFTFGKNFEVILFDKNIELIAKFLKLLYNKEYEIVGVSVDEWNQIKEEYIKNINSGKKYEYINTNEKKNEIKKKSKGIEDKIENIFGNIRLTDD